MSEYIASQFFIHLGLAVDELEEVHASPVFLHNQLEEGVIVKHVDHSHDVWMLQRRQKTDLQRHFHLQRRVHNPRPNVDFVFFDEFCYHLYKETVYMIKR